MSEDAHTSTNATEEVEEKRRRIHQRFEEANEELRDYINTIVAEQGFESLAVILGAKSKEGWQFPTVTDDLMADLRAIAEFIILFVAKETLSDTPAKWTEAQAARVRKIMLAFGLIDETDLRDPQSVRDAVLASPSGSAPKSGGRKYFTEYEGANLYERIVRYIFAPIWSEMADRKAFDPRNNLVCLSSIATGCYFQKGAVPRNETASKKCAITCRTLPAKAQVRRVRIEIQDDTRENTYVYEGIMDHAFVKSRLPSDSPLQSLDMRVSDLGASILNYSMVRLWLKETYKDDMIDVATKYASGLTSHEVLSDQRAKSDGKKKTPPVLKKNKPAKADQCFAAFERCLWLDDGIDHFVKQVYYQVKKIEIVYTVSCFIIGVVYRHQLQVDEERRARRRAQQAKKKAEKEAIANGATQNQ